MAALRVQQGRLSRLSRDCTVVRIRLMDEAFFCCSRRLTVGGNADGDAVRAIPMLPFIAGLGGLVAVQWTGAATAWKRRRVLKPLHVGVSKVRPAAGRRPPRSSLAITRLLHPLDMPLLPPFWSKGCHASPVSCDYRHRAMCFS